MIHIPQRKPKSKIRVGTSVRISPQIKAFLATQANQSEFIEKLIIKSSAYKAWKQANYLDEDLTQ